MVVLITSNYFTKLNRSTFILHSITALGFLADIYSKTIFRFLLFISKISKHYLVFRYFLLWAYLMKVIYVRYTPCVRTIFAIDVFIQQTNFTFVFAWVKWCPTQIVLCLCFVFLRNVCPILPISSDVTGCRKNQVSDCTNSTVFTKKRANKQQFLYILKTQNTLSRS